MKKPLILVTNDDGITAPGLKNLVEVASQFGEVVVVAPDSPQSGQGHAITLSEPLRLKPVSIFGDEIKAFECSGTPVDCVKLGKYVALGGRTADLCVSGINHGSNASINILYSGTMSAAMEASIEGIPSIGFSLMNFSWQADFQPARKYVGQLIDFVLNNGIPGNCNLLNVNIPNLPAEDLKGIKICRQAEAFWNEKYIQKKDPYDRPYYWLAGEFENPDQGEDTDMWALQNGYISVVPAGHDLTHYGALSGLKPMENKETGKVGS